MWATAKMAWLLSALANQHHSQELVVTNIAGQEAKGSVGAAAVFSFFLFSLEDSGVEREQGGRGRKSKGKTLPLGGKGPHPLTLQRPEPKETTPQQAERANCPVLRECNSSLLAR